MSWYKRSKEGADAPCMWPNYGILGEFHFLFISLLVLVCYIGFVTNLKKNVWPSNWLLLRVGQSANLKQYNVPTI